MRDDKQAVPAIVKSEECDGYKVEYCQPFLIVATCGDLCTQNELEAIERGLEKRLSAKMENPPPVIAVRPGIKIDVVFAPEPLSKDTAAE